MQCGTALCLRQANGLQMKFRRSQYVHLLVLDRSDTLSRASPVLGCGQSHEIICRQEPAFAPAECVMHGRQPSSAPILCCREPSPAVPLTQLRLGRRAASLDGGGLEAHPHPPRLPGSPAGSEHRHPPRRRSHHGAQVPSYSEVVHMPGSKYRWEPARALMQARLLA